ncbi:MAG: insulinase family protein, partial [Treponema sp.]|nr:insulinase family protein [Treponema sp.]
MIILRKIFNFFVLFSLIFVNQILANQDPIFTLPQNALFGGLGRPEDPLPPKTGLRKGTLANGLHYYILENSLPTGRAYLTLAVNAGSVIEKDDERGLAHFVEHMAFNGTKRFPGAELINYLRSLGMRFGPEVNAYTSFEETVYGIETPVEYGEDGIKRIPGQALAILDDWTWAITFDPEEVEKERAVILEEYRSRLGARERVRRQMLPVIFQGSLFAERNPIGLPEILQTVTAERLESFYRSWYRTDNMAVILVGDFDGAILEKELADHFTAPVPTTTLFRPRYELPDPQKGSITTAVITDEELPNSTIYLYYKRSPQVQNGTLQDFREEILDYLFDMLIDFRFNEKIAAEDTPYIAIGAWNSRYGQKSRYHIMAANSKAGRNQETLEALLLEKERILRFGFSQIELSRAKAAFLSNLETREGEKDRIESTDILEELTANFLQEQFVSDPEWILNAARRLLPGISLGTINSVIKNYYADDDLTVISVSPEVTVLSGEGVISDLVQKSRNTPIDPPRERTTVSSLVNEDVEPGEIVSVRLESSGAEIWELSNGMRLILFSTANKNNELDFYALARGGTVCVSGAEGLLDGLGFLPEEIVHSSRLAAEIQSASGLGSLSKPELLDFLSGKQLSLSFWTGSYNRGLRGSSTIKDLPALFQMLYASFSRPRIDQTGLDLVLDRQKTRLLQETDNPERLFSKELVRLLYGDHPVYKPLEIKDLESVNGKAVMAFLTLALNPADYTLVFT